MAELKGKVYQKFAQLVLVVQRSPFRQTEAIIVNCRDFLDWIDLYELFIRFMLGCEELLKFRSQSPEWWPYLGQFLSSEVRTSHCLHAAAAALLSKAARTSRKTPLVLSSPP